MPKVDVDGVGTLSFPVPEAQFAAIVRQAERAPAAGRADYHRHVRYARSGRSLPARSGSAVGGEFRACSRK
jgi:hypothetical protein